MNKRFGLLLVILICFGCSESDKENQRETLGKDIANRMKAPVEKTRSITDKIGEMRDVERAE